MSIKSRIFIFSILFIVVNVITVNVSFAQNCESTFIEAEYYLWANGIQTEATSDINGGLDVGYIDKGDWMIYPVTLKRKGNYEISYRVASNAAGGGQLRLEADQGATQYGSINIPNTGGWQNWTTIKQNVQFPFAGTKNIAIAVPVGGWNINWFSIKPVVCLPTITAKQASQEMGKGFNLGQMFESTQHTISFANAKAKIDAYYNRGFRTMRMPITWTENVAGDRLVYDSNVGQINRDHPRLKIIQQVVDYALSLPGMYVVINAHHENDLKTFNRSWVLERLWQDIADIFQQRNHRLIFEILNEPHKNDANKSPMLPADLRSMVGKAYNKIRAVDSDRIILIGGNQWFNYAEMTTTWPNLNDVGGGNDIFVMATFHHYSPWSFNGDNQGSYDDPWVNADISNPMDIMKSWAATVGNGMPVYIGEWGVGWGSRYTIMQCNNIRFWYQMFYQSFAKPKLMPATVWDDGGWFKIFDYTTGTFNNNLVDCIGGTCNWDGGQRFNSGCL